MQEEERDAVEIDEEPRVAEYLALLRQAATQRGALRSATFAPKHALPFLQPGRLVRLLLAPPRADAALPAGWKAMAEGSSAVGQDPAEDLVSEPTVWGAILNFERVGAKQKGTSSHPVSALAVSYRANYGIHCRLLLLDAVALPRVRVRSCRWRDVSAYMCADGQKKQGLLVTK